MSFSSPFLPLALAGLPLAWWLLRATPPGRQRAAEGQSVEPGGRWIH